LNRWTEAADKCHAEKLITDTLTAYTSLGSTGIYDLELNQWSSYPAMFGFKGRYYEHLRGGDMQYKATGTVNVKTLYVNLKTLEPGYGGRITPRARRLSLASP
jgi:hypothetical protein